MKRIKLVVFFILGLFMLTSCSSLNHESFPSGPQIEEPGTNPDDPASGVSSYLITYYENGLKVHQEKLESGKALPQVESTKAPLGQTFLGWSTSKDEYVPVDFDVMPDKEVNLYAFYQKVKYTITFIANITLPDGTTTSKEYEYQDRLGEFVPSDLQELIDAQTEYVFVGWFLDPEFENEFIEVSMPAENITLYAKWQFSGIRFMNGSEVFYEVKDDEGALVQKPLQVPTKPGYDFAGWVDAYGNEVSFPLTVTEEVQFVYASFVAKNDITYKVEHYLENLNGTFVRQDVVELVGTTDELVEALWKSYTGFTKDEDNENNVLKGNVNYNGSLVLKLYYSRNSYKVTFETNGGSQVEEVSYKYEQMVTAPSSPNKLGYTFDGWELNGEAYSFTNMPANDIELSAKWQLVEYTVTFVATEVVGKVTYTVENKQFTEPTVPAIEHFTAAWEEYELTTGNITVKAVYTPITYTVTFIADGVTVDTEDYTVVNPTITEPAIPSKSHYTGVWESYVIAGGNIEVEAIYTPVTYYVTFVAEGAEVAKLPYTVENTTIVEPTVPAKAHYTGAWESYTLTSGNVEVEAIYTPVTYYVTFVAEGAEVAKLPYTVENTTVVNPTVPAKAHYTGAWEAYTLTSGNVEVEAVYTPVTYYVTFVAEGTEVAKLPYTVENTTIAEPTVPTKAHYTAAWESYSVVSGNITVNAVYTPVTYYVTFVAEGAEVAKLPYTVENTTIAEPTVPAKAHYTAAWESYTLTNGNVEVEAIYTPVTYYVTFVAEGTEVAKLPYTVENTTIAEPTVPAKAHYTAAWESYSVVSGNITVNAVYTPVTYYVTFVAEGAEVAKLPYTVENTTIAEPTIPAKAHYTAAWESYTIESGNITVNAVYTAVTYYVTFVAEGTEVAKLPYTIENKAIVEPAVPTKAHYTGAWEAYTLTSGNVEVEAVYIPVTYYVTFVAEGTEVAKLPYTVENTEVLAPAVPAKAHYTGAWETYTLTSGNVEVEAIYTPVTYYVTFIAEGTEVAKLPYTVENTEVLAPTVPAKEHYTASWETYTLTSGNVEVEAIYTPVTYYVTFIADGVEVAKLPYTIENKTIIEPSVPAKENYSGVWENYEVTIGNIEVNAIYTCLEFTISYEFNEGSLDVNKLIQLFIDDYNTYSGQTHTPEAFSQLGSWSEISDSSKFFYNETYKAKWSWLVDYIASVAGSANKKAYENFYNYTSQSQFNSANGNYIYMFAYELRGWVGQYKYTKNSNFVTADYSDSSVQNAILSFAFVDKYSSTSNDVTIYDLVKDGYIFDGWYNNPEFTGNKITTIDNEATGNVVLYAKFSPIPYDIVLDVQGGKLDDSYYGTVVSGDPVKTINISSYDNTGNASGTYFCSSKITSNNSLRWQYKILLNYDEILGAYKVVCVDAATASANNAATAAGVTWTHALANSSSNISTLVSVGQYIILSEAVEVGQKDFKANVYEAANISYGIKPISYTVSDEITLPTPIKTDYAFVGWFTDAEYTGTPITKIEKGTVGDITLYAKWVESIGYTKVVLSDADILALSKIGSTPTIIVNSTFTKDIYEVNETEYLFGSNCFATLADAVAAAKENDVIYVMNGTYSDSFTIATNNVSIYGPNTGISGSDARAKEANISGVITVEAKNVVINGIQLSANGYVSLGNVDNVLITNVYSTSAGLSKATDSGNRMGVIYSLSSKTNKNVTISDSYFNIGSSVYCRDAIMLYGTVTNLTVTGNYFTNSYGGATITEAVQATQIFGNITIDNNTFEFPTSNFVIMVGNYSNEANVTISNNTISGKGSYTTAGIYVRYGSAGKTINIIHNYISNMTGNCMDFRYAKAGSTYNVLFNYFDSKTAYKITYPGSATINYEGNYYASAQTTSTSDYNVITSLADMEEAYRIWLLPSESLTLNANGGQLSSNPTTYKVGLEVELPTPTKEHYTFGGWYTNPEFTGEAMTKILESTTGSLVLYAKFTPVEYTVTFKSEGYDDIVKTYTVENTTIEEPTVPAKVGYTGVWESYTLTSGNVEVNAVYTIINYSITFKANSETIDVVYYTIENSTFAVPNVPEQSGYVGVWENYELFVQDKIVNAIYYEIGYTSEFESSESFTASTTYNNTSEKAFGPSNKQWKTYYGTASTTSPITGNQSMQMRWYTSASSNLGYIYTNFTIYGVNTITFKAANTNKLNVTVYYSIDEGKTWIGGQLFVLSTTATTYTYTIDPNVAQNVRIKFQLTLPASKPTETSRVYIDSVNASFMSAAEKEQNEANQLFEQISLEDIYVENFTLPNINGITWSMSETNYAELNGNNVTVTLPIAGSSDEIVEFTATCVINGNEYKKTYSITIPTAEETPEPAITNATIDQLKALSDDYKAAYYLSGTVSSISNTQYGNFYLEDANGNSIYVYGATASTTALVWNGLLNIYEYTNPKNYNTNALTKAILSGDEVELLVVKTTYNGTPQLNAIVLSVTAHEHEYVSGSCSKCGTADPNYVPVSQTLVADFTAKSAKHSNYTDSWKYGSFTIFGGANNNGGWGYVKMGGKKDNLSKANPVYISTTSAVNFEVSSVTVKLFAGSLPKSGMKVNSWGLYVYDANGNQVDYVAGGTISSSASSFVFTPTSGNTWSSGYTYKVEFNLSNTTTTNGIIWVESVKISS